MSDKEEKFFGEEIPIDLVGTGVTIPRNIGDIDKLRAVLDEMKDSGNDLSKKPTDSDSIKMLQESW